MAFSIRVVIVNPDQEAVHALTKILANIDDIEIIGEAADGENALNIVEERQPNVVLIDDLVRDACSLAGKITREFANTGTIILGKTTEEAYYRKMLKSGVRDFLKKPVQPAALVEAIFEVYEYEKKRPGVSPAGIINEASTRRARIITVFSNKGGVGKTTLAVNLSVTLAKNFKTILWDLDLFHGVVELATDVSFRRDITDLLNELHYMDEDLLAGYLERHESGLNVLPAPFTPEFADFVSGEHVKKILSAARDSWEYVVIDTPPLFTEAAVAAMRESDIILLVGATDLAAIKNLQAGLIVMDKMNFPRTRVKLVMNLVGSEFGISLKKVEKTLKMPVFATIPADAKNVITGINQGTPAAYGAPDSEFAHSMQLLAEALTVRSEPESSAQRKKGLFKRFFTGE